jgi:hypothetical protein
LIDGKEKEEEEEKERKGSGGGRNISDCATPTDPMVYRATNTGAGSLMEGHQ